MSDEDDTVSIEVLNEVEDISFNHLTNHDVVRHKLVGRIVAAYDTYEANNEDDRDHYRRDRDDRHRDRDDRSRDDRHRDR